jgi:hypothetical protein
MTAPPCQIIQIILKETHAIDKVVHWTTPYPVDSWPVDKTGCSKVKTMVGLTASYPLDKKNFQWITPMILCTSWLNAIQTKNRKKSLCVSKTKQKTNV